MSTPLGTGVVGAAVPAAPPRRSPFHDALSELMKQRGVLGALVADARDGIVIASTLAVGIDGDAVAALAASLHQRARSAAAAAGYGDASFFQLQAEHGWLCVTGAGDFVLAAVAEPRANVARLRMSLLRRRGELAP